MKTNPDNVAGFLESLVGTVTLELDDSNLSWTGDDAMVELANELVPLGEIPEEGGNPVAWAIHRLEDYLGGFARILIEPSEDKKQDKALYAAILAEMGLRVDKYRHKSAVGQTSMWEEDKHPRGKPDNAGQFTEKKAEKVAPPPPPPPPKPKAVDHAKMTGEEIYKAIAEVIKEDEAAKKVNLAKTKELRAVWQKAESERRIAATPEAGYEAAAEAQTERWRLHTEKGRDHPETLAAKARFEELNKPANPVAAEAATKVVKAASDALHANMKLSKGNTASKRVAKMLELSPEDHSDLKAITTGVTKKKATILAGIKKFQSIVHKIAVGNSYSVKIRQEKGRDRAAYRSQYSSVELREDGGALSTVVHELGHHLEYINQYARYAVRSFLNQRVGHLGTRKLVHLGKGYGADEYYAKRQDGKKWISNYMGKQYDQGATEILSMGMELYATNPMRLAKGDPELFTLMAKIARGEYNKEAEAKGGRVTVPVRKMEV